MDSGARKPYSVLPGIDIAERNGIVSAPCDCFFSADAFIGDCQEQSVVWLGHVAIVYAGQLTFKVHKDVRLDLPIAGIRIELPPHIM